jgi:mRNA-degrading endonuclease RelE of RelBE toxin-antitoxin system
VTPWTVAFSRTARKGFDAIPEAVDRALLSNRLDALARGEPGVDVKKLRGYAERYRLRSGRWRAILDRDKATHTLWVIDVDDRRDVYR